MLKNEKARIEGRKTLILAYALFSLILSGWCAQDSQGSLGPLSILFSWGAAIFFGTLKLLGLLKTAVPFFSSQVGHVLFLVSGIVTLIASVACVFLYPIFLFKVNKVLSMKKGARFLLLSIVIHAAGSVLAYVLRFRFAEEEYFAPFRLIIYPICIAMILGYQIVDWRLAKKNTIAEGETNNGPGPNYILSRTDN